MEGNVEARIVTKKMGDGRKGRHITDQLAFLESSKPPAVLRKIVELFRKVGEGRQQAKVLLSMTVKFAVQANSLGYVLR